MPFAYLWKQRYFHDFHDLYDLYNDLKMKWEKGGSLPVTVLDQSQTERKHYGSNHFSRGFWDSSVSYCD